MKAWVVVRLQNHNLASSPKRCLVGINYAAADQLLPEGVGFLDSSRTTISPAVFRK